MIFDPAPRGLEHDDKKWEPVFVNQSCDHKSLERDDDSKKRHHALEQAGPCYAFAGFRLFPQQRTLQRDGEIVAIGGRAFDVLLLLVLRAGTVVSLRELMDFVWPSVTVEEANLRVQMGLLRKVLMVCEQAQRAIETVPMRGYCFILPVHHHPGSAALPDRAAALRTTLPLLLNSVFGRDAVIALIAGALDDRRLVTITGPGGIGKTTVAIATANRRMAAHGDRVGYVDLSRAGNADDALRAIADALDLDRTATLATLCDGLQHGPLLLVLDTCEHIVEVMATLVEALLAQCPQLRLLVTSREALRATGEWSHRLASLDFPEADCALTLDRIADFPAVALFLDRAGAVDHFALQARDLPVVAEICRRLDGIPLALEFAAARVSDLGLRAIAAHLGDCLSILTRGRRTALPRHRTLSAALDWSYSLLSRSEQQTLHCLATLPGAVTAEDAIVLCEQAGCQESPQALSSLYEKSLLSVDFRSDAPFYRLLDTTKAYVMAAVSG